MHIEPGFISAAKVLGANAAAASLLAIYLKRLVKSPFEVAKALIAAVFFSVFMQSFHAPVGPSELHFIGAISIYMTLGFVPTIFGFAAGLVLQGLVFDPTDIPHLAVNSLSLILPLIATHKLAGKKLFSEGVKARLSWKSIVKLDAIYYGGVTAMVGFWLMMGETATPFSSWLAFAASYLAIVAVEPFITLMTLKTLKRYEGSKAIRDFTTVGKFKLEA